MSQSAKGSAPVGRRDRGSLLLAIGAIIGVVVAASGVLGADRDNAAKVPSNAVAVVNGEAILLADYTRALRALASDQRNDTIATAAKRRVLERLIDQELLVQRALELELAKRDPRIRAILTDVVISLLVSQAEDLAQEPDEAQLQAFYHSHSDYFRYPGRMQIHSVFFSSRHEGDQGPARQRAYRAFKRLKQGEPFHLVKQNGDPAVAPLPTGWLAVNKLRDYLGPGPTRVIAALSIGQLSEPLSGAGGYTIVQIVAKEPGQLRPFEQVRELVASEVVRRKGDLALKQFLAKRRAQATIAIAEQQL